MRLVLGLGINRLQRATGGGAPAFTPADLFTGTDAGFWSPITTSRLWQDVARTSPVTAAGQSVASWELTTRTGVIYAEQATPGNRPTYEVDVNGKGFLLGSGTSQFMVTNPTLTGGPDYQAFAAYHPLSTAATQNIIDADYIAGGRRWGQFIRITSAALPESIAFSGASVASDTAAAVTAGNNLVLSAIARSAQSVDVRVGGVSNGATATALVFNTYTEQVYLGRTAGSATSFFNGRIYGVILRFGPNLTAGQITSTEAWLQALMDP
jgi:hypothetical protein